MPIEWFKEQRRYTGELAIDNIRDVSPELVAEIYQLWSRHLAPGAHHREDPFFDSEFGREDANGSRGTPSGRRSEYPFPDELESEFDAFQSHNGFKSDLINRFNKVTHSKYVSALNLLRI